MSLRRSFVLVALLSGLMLVVALMALYAVASTTDRARVSEAEEMLTEVVDELALFESPNELNVARVLGVARFRGGTCGDVGVTLEARGGRRRHRTAATISPEQRAFVANTCRQAAKRDQQAHGNATWLVVTAPRQVDGLDDRSRVWAMVSVASGESYVRPLRISIIVLACGTLLLIGAAGFALTRAAVGAGQLDVSVSRLRENLAATVDIPATPELARVGHALAELATGLERARQLERELSLRGAEDGKLIALGRVVAGVAHEVRNPLAGLQLRLDLMARTAQGETREDIDACKVEIERLDRLVRSLLVVGKRETHAVQCSIGPLVAERLLQAQPLATPKSITLSQSGDASAFVDRDAMVQILDNLVRNAIEASPPDSNVEVRIGEESGTVFVRVLDEGEGISPTRATELFEPFFTTKPEGTGLGLWISRSLAIAMGGTLTYERAARLSLERTCLCVSVPSNPLSTGGISPASGELRA